MRRGNKRKFGRERKTRAALYKALATALVEHGRIQTTKAKAKSLSSYVDKLVTRAKKNDLTARRLLATKVGQAAVRKLVADIAPKFSDRQGGYTRVINLPRRQSDGAQMSLIEFVQ